MIRPEILSPSWPQKPLGEVVEFLDHLRRPITAKDRKAGPYPYYGANGQQDSVADYLFDEPLILMAEDGGYFGDPNRTIAYRVEGKCWVNNHAHVLRPKKDVDIDFLCRQLEKYDVSRFINGATRQKLNKSIASEIPITLPPLPEQKRIAAILDKADAIRRKRQAAIKLADDFLRATFLDMFGDPVTNPKGWDKVQLRSICNKITDGTHHSPPVVERGIPYITAKHLKLEGLDFFSNPWFVSEKHHKEIYKRCDPKPGDVLYIKDGVTTGIAAINKYDFEFSMLSSLALLRPKIKSCLAEYLCNWLNHPIVKEKYIKNMSGAAIRRLTLAKIKELEVLLPPKKPQEKFAQIFNHTKAALEKVNCTIKENDKLFNSLTQRAFRGEL